MKVAVILVLALVAASQARSTSLQKAEKEQSLLGLNWLSCIEKYGSKFITEIKDIISAFKEAKTAVVDFEKAIEKCESGSDEVICVLEATYDAFTKNATLVETMRAEAWKTILLVWEFDACLIL